MLPGLLLANGPGNPKKPYSMADEMRSNIGKNMNYDNRPVREIVQRAAARSNINPSFLFSSAYQEGMNKAIARPDDISDAYYSLPTEIQQQYPVDGFYNYGLDRFAERYDELSKKGYLPKDFKYHPFDAVNEKNEKIRTAAFINNEDALVAKAAIMRDEMDRVKQYAETKGAKLDDEDAYYFTLASYNGGFGNAKMMLDQYATAKDRKAFIKNGETTRKGVHKNIIPRLENMKLADELLAVTKHPASDKQPLANKPKP